jgi:ATP-dependent helicase/nuclease subunit A
VSADIRERAESVQRRATDPAASAWVGASAGTGKTKVLTDRALRLLLGGTAPSRLLCITFTRAAAAEMANRITARLAAWATAGEAELDGDLERLLGRAPTPEERGLARRLFAAVLDAPGGMKIQTIHALCQSLLARFPLEAGVAPHFQVLDERSAADMLLDAREAVLAGARLGADGATQEDVGMAEAVAEVVTHATEAGFARLMEALVGERGKLVRLLRAYGGVDGTVGALSARLGLGPDDDEPVLLADACRDDRIDLLGLRLAVQAMGDGAVTDQKRGAAIAAWLAEPERRAERFADYLAAFFTKQGDGPVFAKLIHADALAAAPGADVVLAAEAERLVRVRERLRRVRLLRRTAALMHLGAAILEAYERHKAARALLDYDDLVYLAHELLKGSGAAAWVLYKLDGGLDHVLVDEAQDTNPEQWSVIRALTDEFFAGEGRAEVPRSVFAVGDTKQSIFSFQRADPAMFTAMRDGYAAQVEAARGEWRRVDLGISFRSTAAVLDTVDAVFADPEARDGVVSDGAAPRHSAARTGHGGRVELWPLAAPDPAGDETPWTLPTEAAGAEAPRSRLARLVAWHIWRWTTASEADCPEAWLPARGRRVLPRDVLVLVRRRNAFVVELVRALKERGVPVAGVDRMVLRDQVAVMDLVALGRFLLLPEDDLTLAVVLKGPFVGLDDMALFDLAYGRGERSLWAELSRRRAEPRWAAAHAFLAALLAKADYVPSFELYAEVLGPRQGREMLLGRLGPDAADPIEEFLSLALTYEASHTPSLEGFLHWLTAGAQEVKRDLDQGGGEVRVMTVHGAKGLQAPIVILPDTASVPQLRDELLWLDGEPDLLLWPPGMARQDGVSAAARTARERAMRQEHRRLLYVAMTRAEDRLYVCGWAGRSTVPDDCWYRRIEAGLRERAIPFAFEPPSSLAGTWTGAALRLETPQEAAPEDDRAAAAQAPALDVVPDWARRPAPAEPEPPRPLAPSRPDVPDPPLRSPLAAPGVDPYRRGRLVHALLEALPDLAEAERAAACRRYLARPAHGLDEEAREAIARETLAVLDDPRFAPLFAPGSRPEVPIVGRVSGRVVSGQVDRLVVTDEAVLVVDYKSNRPPPVDASQVPPAYLRQMAAYAAVLAQVYPGRAMRCALLWTDGPHLMPLSEAALAAHAPGQHAP